MTTTTSTTSSSSNSTTTIATIHYKEAICDIVASIIGSTACVYSGQPFDTIKVRLQVDSGGYTGSMWNCFRKSIQSEGISSLWKGSIPALVGALSENTVAFACNGLINRFYSSHLNNNNNNNSTGDNDFDTTVDDQPTVVESMLIGGVTGAFSAIALCPCDVVKCRAQVNLTQGVGATDVQAITRQILRAQGIAGLYTGIHAQFLRDVPFYATFFGSYALLGRALRQHTQLTDSAIYFLSGGLAGQLGWIVSIVPDTIKSRIQTRPASGLRTGEEGVLSTARTILRAQGVRGLFAGVEAALIRAFPANAALFLGYEMSREIVADMVYT